MGRRPNLFSRGATTKDVSDRRIPKTSCRQVKDLPRIGVAKPTANDIVDRRRLLIVISLENCFSNRASIKRPVRIPVSLLSAVECYPCR
jgi:hypothetical protein